MKEIKIKVLKFDLPRFTNDFQCIVQVGKVSDLPLTDAELVTIKGTELNEFAENPAEDHLREAIKKKFNPLLEHKGQVLGEILFKKAKLTEDKSK